MTRPELFQFLQKMTYAGAGAFMVFSRKNAKLLRIVSVHNELLFSKKLSQEYDCKFLKDFDTRFNLRISPQVKRLAYTSNLISPIKLTKHNT